METFDILKIQEHLVFAAIVTELEYLKQSIDILIKNYQNDFKECDEMLKSAMEKIKKEGLYDKPLNEVESPAVTHGQKIEYDLSEPFEELQTFSQTIIESLLIKHVAHIEHTIVKLSYIIQKKENEKIAPNYNIKSGIYTDMLKAIDYIALVTDSRIRIKDLKDWKMIYHLRALRHKLAHGESYFELKEGIINEINREIQLIDKSTIPIVKNFDFNKGLAQYGYEASQLQLNENTLFNCSICSTIQVLLRVNQICVEFIQDVRKNYFSVYPK